MAVVETDEDTLATLDARGESLTLADTLGERDAEAQGCSL